jgi:hypothetical protein
MVSFRSLAILSFTLLGACASVETFDGAGPDERRPLGKADNIGSCQGDELDFCGGPSDGTCWCDDLCHTFGDCCGDKTSVCDGEPDVLCMSDDQCGADQVCDHTECLSNCQPGQICPAVCWGQCADVEPEEPNCGDGSVALCLALPPECPEGQFSPVINHCWGPCVDIEACAPDPVLPCSDGTFPVCEIVPPECPEGTVLSVQNGCFGPCVDPSTCEPPEATACEDIEAALDAETLAIRSCTADAECGQVLAGTSCGCTRNWVARTDADITQWSELREAFFDQQCGIGPISTCDCPAVDGFACVDSMCTWNYL